METDILAQEDARMETPSLEPLVIHHITSLLPMKYFHDLARPTHEDIDIPVGWIKSNQMHLSAQAIDSYPHNGRMQRHDDPIIFIQIKHVFFD